MATKRTRLFVVDIPREKWSKGTIVVDIFNDLGIKET